MTVGKNLIKLLQEFAVVKLVPALYLIPGKLKIATKKPISALRFESQ